MVATIFLRFYSCCFTTTNHQATKCSGDCSCGKVPRSAVERCVLGLQGPSVSPERTAWDGPRAGWYPQFRSENSIDWLGKSSAETKWSLGFNPRNSLQPIQWQIPLEDESPHRKETGSFPMSLSKLAFWNWSGWWSHTPKNLGHLFTQIEACSDVTGMTPGTGLIHHSR